MSLFTPLHLREIEFKNRIGVSPDVPVFRSEWPCRSVAPCASRESGRGRGSAGDDGSFCR